MSQSALKHKLVARSSYVPPDTGEAWLMDIYFLHELWLNPGGAANEKFLPTVKGEGPYHQLRFTLRGTDELGDLYQAALYSYSEALYKALSAACYSELEQATDENLIPPSVLYQWLHANGNQALREAITRKESHGPFQLHPYQGFYSRVGWSNVIKVFQAEFWQEHADLYGGQRWSEIATAALAIIHAFKHGEVEDSMASLDYVVGLQHNTGSIMSKRKVGKLAVSQEILNLRNSPQMRNHFLPLVSPQIRKLIEYFDRDQT